LADQNNTVARADKTAPKTVDIEELRQPVRVAARGRLRGAHTATAVTNRRSRHAYLTPG
jgi:hypothetical protein